MTMISENKSQGFALSPREKTLVEELTKRAPEE